LLLIDLVTLGALSAAGPFFNNFLKKLPYFIEKGGSAFDNAKDTTMNLIGQSTTIAKDVMSSGDNPWTDEGQNAFADYIGKTINAWRDQSSQTLHELFQGSDQNIANLWDAISDGKLIGGSGIDIPSSNETLKALEPQLRANIAKSLFAFSIPNLWRASSSYAFVMDSGYGCDEGKALSDYLDDDTMKASGACVDGKQYYLVYPDGSSTRDACIHDKPNSNQCTMKKVNNKFSTPPGLGSLKGDDFGGITKEDLIKGSLRTYTRNGNQNGASAPNPKDKSTFNDLLEVDITTPGYIRLPICSPEHAFQGWDSTNKGSSDNYPCDVPPGKDFCGDSTFEDETTDGSPKIEDCRQIIKNIEHDAGTSWKTQVLGKRQRGIAPANGCVFGVEATEQKGNADFLVGGQDVIDIINDAISRFGRDGRIGAKGNMNCKGNIKGQAVKWGIYKK
jgi:hypothetical protein